MHKAVEIGLLIVLPLLWGLGVEYVFEFFRRRRADKSGREQA